MKLLGLLALAVAISASSIHVPRSEWLDSLVPERVIEDNEFLANREYKFFYNGQLATGIPGSSSQHSATRIQALVSLIFRSKHECMMQLVECRFGRRNDEINTPRHILPFRAFEQLEIESELLDVLSKPIKFNYRQGMIDEIHFDRSEQPWSANIKRGVLNLLQVNLEKKGELHTVPSSLRTDDSQIENKLDTFSCIEPTLEGECETDYTFVSMPCRDSPLRRCRDRSMPVLNITKSINFEKCQKRPEVRYNHRFEQICPTCEQRYTNEERLTRSSTVGQLNLVCKSSERKSCLIERSSIESQYHFIAFNEKANIITTYVNQTLELVKTCDIETDMPALNSPIRSDSDLVFTQDWDVKKEQFFMEGETEFQKETPYSPLKNKVQFVKSILRKLVHYMNEKVEEEAPRQFTRLVKVLRMLKRDEIKECHEKFFKSAEGFTREEHQKIKDLLVDAVGLCGTYDCIEHIVHVVKNDEISSIKASFVIRKLMEARVVSPRMVEKLMHLCKSTEKCERHPVLKQAVFLTCGSMMRTMCVDSRDKFAIESKSDKQLCPSSIKEKFVQELMEKFESTESEYEKILCLKSLSNAGLDVSIKRLEKIVLNIDRVHTQSVRIEAILAMRQLCDVIPDKIIKTLMPIYMNRREPSHVRITALYQLLQCQPPKPILDQIARSMTTERSMQVTSFTYTLLETMANSTIPCEKRMANDLKLSLRMSRYVPTSRWIKNSKFVRFVDYYCPKTRLGMTLDMASVFSNISVVPQTWALNLNAIGNGQWSPRLLTLGFRQDGLGRIFNRVLRGYSHNVQSSLEDLLSGNFQLPSPRFNYRDELKSLFEKLNTVERVDSESEPFGNLYMKFKNQEYGFIPLNKEIIPEEIKELIMSSDSSINKVVKRAERLLKDVSIPFSVHTATFVNEMSRKIPTSLGLPLRISVKTPTVMQASGTFKVEVDSSSPLKKIKLIVDDFKPSIVMTSVTKVECWSPIVNSGVKVLAQAKINSPFDASVSVDMKKQPAEVKLSLKPKLSSRQEIVTLQTRPISFTLVWPKFLEQWKEPQEKTIHGEDWTRVNTHDVVFGERTFGIKMHSRSHWHRTPAKRVPSTPLPQLAGVNKYSLTMEPGYEMPNEYVMRVSGKWFKNFDKKTISPKFGKFYEDSSEDFLSKESSSSEEREESIINSEYYRTYKGKFPVGNEFEVELFTTGSSIKRKCVLGMDWTCDRDMKTCQAKIEIERTPVPVEETKPWKLVCNVKTLYPKTPFTINEITAEKKFMCEIDSKWGMENNMNKKLNVKIVAEQSGHMLELKDRSSYKRLFDSEEHRNSYRSLFSPVAQYKQTLKYGLLDEYKVDMDYELPTYERELINKWYRFVKHYYYSQSKVQNIDIANPEGRVRAKFNIDPLNRRYLNITIMTPNENCKLEDIPLPMEASFMNMRRVSTPSRSFSHMLRQWFSSEQPICEVRSNRMTTFDGVKYDVPTSTCFSVLAKDCYNSQRSKFAVLIKKHSTSTEKKTIKIVTPTTKLIIRPNGEKSLECELNGEKKPCNELREITEHNNHIVLSCRMYGKEYIRCELPEAGLRVYFDGFSANVKVSPLYRSHVCGLCGQFDLDTDNEFTDSRRSLVSRRSMFESFLAENENCEHEFPESETVLSFDDDRFNDLPETIRMPVRSRTHDVRPVEVTKMIEQSHELCFSKHAVKKCPRHTYPIEHEQNKQKIVYSCLPRSSLQAEQFQRRAKYDDLIVSEVSELSASFTESERVPKICRQY